MASVRANISAALACVGKSAFSHRKVRNGLGWIELISPVFSASRLMGRESLIKSLLSWLSFKGTVPYFLGQRHRIPVALILLQPVWVRAMGK